MLWCSSCKSSVNCYRLTSVESSQSLQVGWTWLIWWYGYLYSVKQLSSHWIKPFQGLETVNLINLFSFSVLLCHLAGSDLVTTPLDFELAASLESFRELLQFLVRLYCHSSYKLFSQVAPCLAKLSVLYSPASILLCNSPLACGVGLHE